MEGGRRRVEDLAEVLLPPTSCCRRSPSRRRPSDLASRGRRPPLAGFATRWTLALAGGRVRLHDHDGGDGARPSWTDWLRTYRGHDRGATHSCALGSQDITCEVAIDQLAAVREPVSVRDQRARS